MDEHRQMDFEYLRAENLTTTSWLLSPQYYTRQQHVILKIHELAISAKQSHRSTYHITKNIPRTSKWNVPAGPSDSARKQTDTVE